MTFIDLRNLAMLSVSDPAAAARQLMSMQIPRNILWSALFLVATLNTIIFTISDLLVPGPTPLGSLFSTPFTVFGMVAGGLFLTVYSIFWTGRVMGGKAAVDDIMVLIVWLQFLRLLVQAAVLVLVLTIPMISALLVSVLVLVAVVMGLYILLHFVKQAHQLESLGYAAGITIVSMLIPVMGLAVLFALFGVPFLGTVGNV